MLRVEQVETKQTRDVVWREVWLISSRGALYLLLSTTSTVYEELLCCHLDGLLNSLVERSSSSPELPTSPLNLVDCPTLFSLYETPFCFELTTYFPL